MRAAPAVGARHSAVAGRARHSLHLCSNGYRESHAGEVGVDGLRFSAGARSYLNHSGCRRGMFPLGGVVRQPRRVPRSRSEPTCKTREPPGGALAPHGRAELGYRLKFYKTDVWVDATRRISWCGRRTFRGCEGDRLAARRRRVASGLSHFASRAPTEPSPGGTGTAERAEGATVPAQPPLSYLQCQPNLFYECQSARAALTEATRSRRCSVTPGR